MRGFKTYIVSITMIALGLWFLHSQSVQNWDNPTATGAELEAMVRRVIGWVLVTQGAGLASLRHAIGRL